MHRRSKTERRNIGLSNAVSPLALMMTPLPLKLGNPQTIGLGAIFVRLGAGWGQHWQGISPRYGYWKPQTGPAPRLRSGQSPSVLRQKLGKGEMMYNIIFQTFITPDKLTHQEILYRLDISDRHYYRLRQQAVNILSIRLWTAPAGCLDAWLELLTLLKGT